MTFQELAAELQVGPQNSLYTFDPAFFSIWSQLRSGGLTVDQRATLKEQSERGKRLYREWLREVRTTFKPAIEQFQQLGITKSWPEMLQELESEGLILRQLRSLIKQEGPPELVRAFENAPCIDYRTLPCTAAWVQYYTALPFLAVFQRGKVTRPDLGDQVDFRHAAYAGLADTFVTDDDRIQYVLKEMVFEKRADIRDTKAFLQQLQSASQ